MLKRDGTCVTLEVSKTAWFTIKGRAPILSRPSLLRPCCRVSAQELSLNRSFKQERHFVAQYDERYRLIRWMKSVAGDGDHVKLGGS